ncbi:methyl-accepting chemotaxis protein [Alkalihalobacterium chitinilyticum]|uniref:Methyl-accepting chemotaxis protein n=1 Tax=Alkalihalobacterium chitinilyticum TaxID=2980103 RepID=A0ABT5VJM6_9BACI|nr:methyl-accepting chemotaxis protein [Alkalihalobacterium chitinilyticum]MDE5415396.1 methyl-accepting chemotaxis protein [Alkalihalobacterium chitinilyticum]
MNLKNKLLFTFLLLLIIPSLVIGTISYQSAKSSLENQMMDGAMENTNIVNQKVNEMVSSKMAEADFLSKLISQELYDGWESPKVRQILDGYVVNHPELDFAYLGTFEGEMIRQPNPGPESEGFDPRTRPWYEGAMADTSAVNITQPYIAISTGRMVVTISKATSDLSGVIGLQMDLTDFQDIISTITIGEEGFVFILDENNVPVVHPELEIGEPLEADWGVNILASDSGQFDYVNLRGQSMRSNFVTNELTGWTIGSTISEEEIERSAAPIFNITLSVIIAAIIVGVALAYFVIKSITRPLEHLKELSEKVSKGNLSVRADIRSKDEIGIVGASFNRMLDSFSSILNSVGDSSNHLSSSAQQLTASAEQTTLGTESVSNSIEDISQGVDEQVNIVNELSETMKNMNERICNIVEHADSSSTQANFASEKSSEGEQSILTAVKKMGDISESVQGLGNSISELGQYSQEIGQIISVITNISEQTNLLALNAAIESARAGEHGKGFSVVASEVRKLAELSAANAKQITSLIRTIQSKTDEAIKANEKATGEVKEGILSVNNAGQLFEEIQEAAHKVAKQVKEVSILSNSISQDSLRTVEVVDEFSTIAQNSLASIERISAASEEQLASMEEITSSANSLSDLADELQGEFRKYKA